MELGVRRRRFVVRDGEDGSIVRKSMSNQERTGVKTCTGAEAVGAGSPVMLFGGRRFDLDEFMSRRLMAHLATATPGGPRDTPVWFLWEEGCVWIISVNNDDTFPKKIRDCPRCAVGIVDFRPESGLVQHVGIRGEGSLSTLCKMRAGRLLAKYLGDDVAAWDRRFRWALDAAQGTLLQVTPHSVIMRDQSFQAHQRASRRSDPDGWRAGSEQAKSERPRWRRRCTISLP